MNRNILLAVPFLAVFPLIACGPGSHSAVESQAKTPAQQADAQLSKDGYRPLHVPGFGKADVGIKISGKGYELVYTAKDAELVKTAVYEANKHPEQGVSFKAAGNLAIVDAGSLKELKTGLQSLATSLR